MTESSGDDTLISTGLSNLDYVLGGGLTPGSVTLIGGEPGIGKSTLLLEMMRQKEFVYVSGEESLAQIKNRATRLGIVQPINVVQGNRLQEILAYVIQSKCRVALIDSIQTVYSDERSGFSGSISQVRESAQQILETAKAKNIAFILTGHITKDGQIAGPKILEHAVDTVLYFEQSQASRYRFIRATKNRFGATGDLAIFEMVENGLRELASDTTLIPVASIGGVGSAFFPQVEGSRVLPLEVQVLVTPTGFANGRRIGENVDLSRIHIIAAILEKFSGMKLSQCDIFVRVNGGTHLSESAADLALLFAMASSYLEKPLRTARAIAGEVTLTGQIRSPGSLEIRRRALSQWKVPAAVWGGEIEKSTVLNEKFLLQLDRNLEELF